MVLIFLRTNMEIAKMKRIALLLCIVLIALSMTGCTRGYHYDQFDVAKEGIVDVIVIARKSIMSNREESETRYYSLASGDRICLSEAFETDPAIFYTIPNGCFESYIDRDRNKVLNRLDHMALKDEAGNQVPVSETHASIFQRIAELEHDMFHIRLIETENQTFVYLELNVNLWTPCCLYWYDRDADVMVLLHKWDAEEVTGLRLRNITLAGQDKSN